MTINYTGSVSFSSLRTEFGFSGSVKLSNYRIGGGYTANHENNSAIPTTNSNLALSKWWRSDKDYESNAGMGYTGSASWTAGQTTTVPTSTNGASTSWTGIDTVAWIGANIGTAGTINVLGYSKSSTNNATLVTIFNFEDTINFGASQTQTGAVMVIQGNSGTADLRGTWWTSVTVTRGGTSVTLNRTAATTPNGIFDGVYTIWDWSDTVGPFDPFFPFVDTAAHSIRITLS